MQINAARSSKRPFSADTLALMPLLKVRLLWTAIYNEELTRNMSSTMLHKASQRLERLLADFTAKPTAVRLVMRFQMKEQAEVGVKSNIAMIALSSKCLAMPSAC